jgi:hypothetical protein
MIEGKPFWKWLIAYVLILLVGFGLFAATVGGVGGLLTAYRLNTDPAYLQQAKQSYELLQRDLSAAHTPRERQAAWQREIQRSGPLESNGDRFVRYLLTDLIAFAILGLIAGLTGIVRFAGLIPIGLLFTTASFTSGPHRTLFNSHALTVLLNLLMQLAIIYLFAYAVFRLRRRKTAKPQPSA